MPYALKIALRYLTANRAQSGLLVSGVAVGVFIFIFMSALIGGLAELLVDRTVGSIAHVTIEPAQRDAVSLFPDDDGALVAILRSNDQRANLRNAAAFLPIIEAQPGVTAIAQEIVGSGFLSKGQVVEPMAVTGVEPDQVSAIANIGGHLVSGSADLTIDTVLIGSGLANDMGLVAGQTVVLRSDRGVERTLTVGGIFSLGVAALDESAAYVSIRAARTLFDMPEGISRIEIKLANLAQAPAIADRLAAATGLKATPWTKNNQELLDGLTAQANTGDLIKGFALLTIVIGVASALLLSTYRRRPEIGIMRAMGATKRFVILVFVIQGLLVGFFGGLLGAGLAWLALSPFPPPASTPSGGLPIDIGQGAFATAIMLTTFGAVLAAIWPARAAARVDPVSVISQ